DRDRARFLILPGTGRINLHRNLTRPSTRFHIAALQGSLEQEQPMSSTATRTPSHGFRILAWSAAACLLLIPLLARAPWTLSDYIAAAVLLGGAGGALELAIHFSRGSLAYRAAAA